MKSFKTMKIAVLSGLMLNLAMPVQAGFAATMAKYSSKAMSFLGKPAKFFGLLAAAPIIGGGIGYALSQQKSLKNRVQHDKEVIAGMIDALEQRGYPALNQNIDELTTVKDFIKASLKAHIAEYHECLKLYGANPIKVKARETILETLKWAQNMQTGTPGEMALKGALIGIGSVYVGLVALGLVDASFNRGKNFHYKGMPWNEYISSLSK